MKLFVQGRKNVFETLRNSINKEDKTIWFHCASLGEFEQGFPIMKAVKRLFPEHKLVVTFFSPSGYEIKKNNPIADVITYLPLDTSKNARTFLNIIHPYLVIFVKYEFWPNYLFVIKKMNINSLLISGLFRSSQSFFRPYGNFMRKSLKTFDHLFVQNENSKKLLQNINIANVTVSGDTRFDRVLQQIKQDNYLGFVEEFKGNSICIVCGSTWLEDEAVLLEYINSVSSSVKFIIAPHKIEALRIDSFRAKLNNESVLYTNKDEKNLENYNVLIIDTIGLLSKIYHYADISYIGGALGGTGLHNILEAATFGIPVIIGPHFEKFPEAIELQSKGGLFSIKNATELSKIMNKLVVEKNFRKKTGMIAGRFVNSHSGATQKIMDHILNQYRKHIL